MVPVATIQKRIDNKNMTMVLEEFVKYLNNPNDSPCTKNDIDAQMCLQYINCIKYHGIPEMEQLVCSNCKLLPQKPLTPPCGHTRCSSCIAENDKCFCGERATGLYNVNVVINDIIEKMTHHYKPNQGVLVIAPPTMVTTEIIRQSPNLPTEQRWIQYEKFEPPFCGILRDNGDKPFDVPVGTRFYGMTLERRFQIATELFNHGLYALAKPHVANFLAFSKETNLDKAKYMLNVCLMKTICKASDLEECDESIKNFSLSSFIELKDLECILCLEPFKDPVTVDCGHTYCRVCLLRNLTNLYFFCPICKTPFEDMDICDIPETTFLTTVIILVLPELELEANRMPMIVNGGLYLPCVVFPLLLTIDGEFDRMLKFMEKKGRNKFVLVQEEDDTYTPEYGTIMEIRDLFKKENGQTHLTAVGIGRCKIKEVDYDYINKSNVVRAVRIIDKPVHNHPVIQSMVQVLAPKVNTWLDSFTPQRVRRTERLHGSLPYIEVANDHTWWLAPDGPEWLWKLLWIMPLTPKSRSMALQTQHLLSRLTMVHYAVLYLDDQDREPDTSTYESDSDDD